MRRLIGPWLVVAAMGFLGVSCDSGTTDPSVFRVATCADKGFVEIALPDEFDSPTARGFVFTATGTK